MLRILVLLLIFISFAPQAQSASYTWPADLTGSPFNCYYNGIYGCFSSITIPPDSQVSLSSAVSMAITGDLTIGSGFLGVITNGYPLNITVYGDVTINQGSTFTGNITATGNVILGNQTTFNGDITSYADVTIGTNSHFTGNITTTGTVNVNSQAIFTGDIFTYGNISLGTNGVFTGNITTTALLNIGLATVVYGVCTPAHPQCSLVTPGCDTLADNFDVTSYSNQNGTINWSSDWSETNDDNSPSTGEIRITGNRLNIENDNRSITRDADLSSYATATLSFNYQESGFDNNNDYIDIEVQGGGNGWTSLQNFAGPNVNSGTANLTIPGAYLSNDFQLRLITSNRLGGSDRLYVDNLEIEACGASSAPQVDYHFDSLAWTGAADEVLDDSGNAYNASIANSSGLDTISTGAVCRGAHFDGNNDYIVSNDLYSLLRTTASLSFWIKTTQTGNDTNWLAPGVIGVEEAGAGDDIFWGWLDASGHIGISKWDTPSAKSTTAINDDIFHHVVLTRDSPSGAYKIYIDGALEKTGTTGTGDVGTFFSSIGRIEDTDGTPIYLQADLDEVMVFDSVLSDAQVSDIYTNQAAGNNYDGSSRSCPGVPLAEWRFDEAAWNGSSGEVLDSQGTLNASAANGATTGGSNPAIVGSPGTCRYGTFDGVDDYVDLTGMTDLSDSFTITAWIYANDTGNDQRIYADDQNNSNGFALSLGDGGSGQLRFFSRSVNPISVDTQSAVISTGRWYHVAAVHDVSAKTRQIYVDGTPVILTGGVTAPTYTGTWGVDSGAASIGGENDSAGGEASANWRFNGNIDEVRVYQAALSASEITNIMNVTRPCSITGPDHYEISHSGTGITCAPEAVTVTAHNADHSLFSVANDTSITVTSSPAVDAITSSPVTILAGQSSATFTITETTMTTTPHVNINVSDGAVSETSGGATAADDPALAFVDSLFQFVRDTNIPPATHINTQIGGKPSSTAPNAQNLYLRAVRTDDTTGSPVCVAALDAGTHNINMGYQCLDPNNCNADELSVSNNLTYDSGAATTLAHNDGATMGNSSAVTLNFDNSGYAPLSFVYNNVGEIALFTGDYITLNGGMIASGISDQFVVRPFGLTLDFDNGSGSYNMRQQDWSDGVLDGSAGDDSYSDPSTNPQNSTVFQTAGSDFPAEITAVLWQAGDDSDNNGEPDAGANLYNNSSATLFGQQSSAVTQIAHTLQEPAGANPGALTTSFSNPYVNGSTTGTMSWNEVGIIDIQLSLASFLGDTSFTSSYSVEDVGRFRPAGFRIQAGSANNGVLDNSCGAFSYIGQDFGYLVNPAFVVEAINTASLVTTNYRGDWNKLTSGSFPISVVSNDGSNALDIVHTQAGINYNPVGNGVFNVAFGDDTFCYGLEVSGSCVKQSNAQLAEFTADITMTLATIADGEVSTAIGQDFSPILGQLRFGRLAMDNVFGSELIGLTMPMRTQYFDGSNFILNVNDGCTTIDHSIANELTVTAVLSGGSSTVEVASTTAAGGVLDVTLSAPGEDNTGYIDVTPNLNISGETWLQFDWDGDGNHDNNPTGRANFGIYRGDDRQIYYRQIYQ